MKKVTIILALALSLASCTKHIDESRATYICTNPQGTSAGTVHNATAAEIKKIENDRNCHCVKQ